MTTPNRTIQLMSIQCFDTFKWKKYVFEFRLLLAVSDTATTHFVGYFHVSH